MPKVFFAVVLLGGAVVGASYLKDYVNLGALSLESSGAGLDSLAKAQELYDQGNLTEARKVLEPVAEGRDLITAPQATVLLAKLNRIQGKSAENLALLEAGVKRFSASPEYARVAVAYGRALEDAGKLAEAGDVFEVVRNSAPPELRAPALTGLGRKAERQNDLLGARDLYRNGVKDAAWNSREWAEAVDALGSVNVNLIFSPMRTPESKVYSVQRGDSITSIGNSLNTTQGLLLRANGISEDAVLNLNQQIKYTPKDFRIVIERAQCRLFLLDKEGIFKQYTVGLGQPGHETTLGTFKIGNKEKNPTWHKPGVGPILYGDPRNELGTRWMPLVPDQQGLPTDLGIHGTIRPETVGLYSSNGCVRLLPADIEELYDLVVRATPVEIVQSYSGKEPALPASAPQTQAEESAGETPAPQ
ncbi:MAG TPA: L,D-transpeptidase family protein [Candidatus Bathyarchaeia archaeon]|nr:L,D-transpeptidase family protein [Candidatus Bathyarchaeia archaeon]